MFNILKVVELFYVIFIASVMAILGLLIVTSSLGYKEADGLFYFYLKTVFVSNLLWIPVFYLWIRKIMTFDKKLFISIVVPLMGCCVMAFSPFGIIYFLMLFFVFIPISYFVIYLLSFVKLSDT